MTSQRIIRPTPATDSSPYDVARFPRPASWTEEAACAGQETDLFFSDRDLTLNAAAKRVCAGCRVQTRCLRDAIARGEEYGIFGGINFANRDDRRTVLGGNDVA